MDIGNIIYTYNMGRRDIAILFSTRILRMFAYGFLSVVLAFYLIAVGLDERAVGLVFTLTLVGDAGISLWLTTSADRLGRRRMLQLGAFLMVIAGGGFLLTSNPLLLTAAAIIGVISPSGNEIGPFLSIEQAALSQLIPDDRRTKTFAWYNLSGSFATASGALGGGWLATVLQSKGWSALASYRTILTGYALAGGMLMLLFTLLSPVVEASQEGEPVRRVLGLHRSQAVVIRLAGLFAMDAFAGGLIVQSLMAYWFNVRFGVDEGVLGGIFFGANILAGISALLAARLAGKFGLINTMVFTHIPSSILLMLVPLMPSLGLAITALLLRFSISQMDVPTRQSYTMAVVTQDERAAASGVTTIARSVGAALSPSLSGLLISIPSLFSSPFFLCGGIKILYDLILYRSFKGLKPPEET
jgi:MFS family permease